MLAQAVASLRELDQTWWTHQCDDDLVATVEPGPELSVATIRRMACDAEIIPAVLGSKGEPFDVGRSHRLVTGPIWTALVLRDAHCAFPGCNRPPVMCHAHHTRHWLHGGKTKLENLVCCVPTTTA